VENPNNVLQEDLQLPSGMTALLNGTLARQALTDATLLRNLSLVSDETQWIGSLNDRGDLDYGNIANPRNNDVSDAFNNMAEVRFLADEALKLAEEFQAAGTLQNRSQLMQAYENAGMAYARIGELWDDFVFSDRAEAAPPIGKAQIPAQFDKAIAYYDKALEHATALNNTDKRREILALRARAKWVRAARQKISGGASPLVNDAGAVADAQAFFATNPSPDWKFEWLFSGATGNNTFGNDVTQRLEQRVTNDYVVPTADGRRVASVRLQDPISGEVDPVLLNTITNFTAAGDYPSITVVSARELRLILAEAALAAGDNATFTTQINAIRALNGLPAYSGQVPALDLLKHMRRVNLFFQGKRLYDMYRFGIQSPQWLTSSNAFRAPGTLFPIGFTEQISNCHIVGTC